MIYRPPGQPLPGNSPLSPSLVGGPFSPRPPMGLMQPPGYGGIPNRIPAMPPAGLPPGGMPFEGGMPSPMGPMKGPGQMPGQMPMPMPPVQQPMGARPQIAAALAQQRMGPMRNGSAAY